MFFFLPERGEVHPETAPLEALCCALCSTEQSTFPGGETGDKVPRKGTKRGGQPRGNKLGVSQWNPFWKPRRGHKFLLVAIFAHLRVPILPYCLLAFANNSFQAQLTAIKRHRNHPTKNTWINLIRALHRETQNNNKGRK